MNQIIKIKKVNLGQGNIVFITKSRESGDTYDKININPSCLIESSKTYRLDMNTIILPRVPIIENNVISIHQNITIIQGKVKLLIYNFDRKSLVSESITAGESIDIEGRFGIGFRSIVPNAVVLFQYEKTPEDFVKINLDELTIPKEEIESILPYCKIV